MIGPGKYNDICTYARTAAKAESAVLLIIGGEAGNGLSVQGSLELHMMLPGILENLAEHIRDEAAVSDNLGLMEKFHTTAYALLTIGKVAGILKREDVRSGVIDALKRGELNPHYLTMLRDLLTEVLEASAPPEFAA